MGAQPAKNALVPTTGASFSAFVGSQIGTLNVTSIFMPVTEVGVAVGEAFYVNAYVQTDGSTETGVNWASSDYAVATVWGVDASPGVNVGAIAGIAPGAAIITATSKDDGRIAMCDVAVTRTHQDAYFIVEGEDQLANALMVGQSGGQVGIALKRDIDINSTLVIPSGSDITLVGSHKLVLADGATIRVDAGATLTIDGPTVAHQAVTASSGIATLGSGALGSGVTVEAGGTLDLLDGTVSDNNADLGAGVYNQGTFNMTGGRITKNTATTGGGVYNDGTMNMSGGSIDGNNAADSAAGIAMAGAGAKLVLGGTAAVAGNNNTGTGLPDDVNLPAGAYITLGDGTNGADLPSNMSIYVTKTADGGVIIDSGASSAIAQMFFSSATGNAALYDHGVIALDVGSLDVPVTGIGLDKPALTMIAGGTEALTATTEPDDATNKDVTWSSDNTAVATVDGNGNVLAKAAGTATVTVTTKDGGYSASSAVTVFDLPDLGSNGLVFDASTGELYVQMIHDGIIDPDLDVVCPGEGKVWSADGSTLYLNNFTCQSSSANALMVVNGAATIDLTGDNSIVSYAVLNFSLPAVTTGLYATSDLQITGSGSLTVQGGEADGRCSTTGIMTGGTLAITGGTVTSIGGNQAGGSSNNGNSFGTICSTFDLQGGIFKTVSGDLENQSPSVPSHASGLRCDTLGMSGGTFEASGFTYALESTLGGDFISLPSTYTWWASTDSMPPSDGTLSTVAPYTYSNTQQYLKIVASTVATVPVQGVSISLPAFAMLSGTVAPLSVTFDPADATDQDLVWTSSDEQVATVDAGGSGINSLADAVMVHAVGPGTATVTATSVDGGFSTSCTIKVLDDSELSDYGLIYDPATSTLYVDTNENGIPEPGVDIVCPGGGGAWSADGQTLTLTDFTWKTSAASALVLRTSQSGVNTPMTIELKGSNSLASACDSAVPSSGGTSGIAAPGIILTLSGDGSLDVTAGPAGTATNLMSIGISATGGLTVDGPVVTTTAGAALGPNGASVACESTSITLDSGTLNATGGPAFYFSYGVYAYASGVSATVNKGTLNAVGGDASFGPAGISTGIDGNVVVNGGIVDVASGSASNLSIGVDGGLTVDGGAVSISAGPSDNLSCGIYTKSSPLQVVVGAGSLTVQGQTQAVHSDSGQASFDPLGSYTWW
ncbi:MAG: Ig-like domain-containing protein, partial [Coriobacteriia bacterium]|nr:Ig-like domain-containing protein [Coriobacteriia bacterium]